MKSKDEILDKHVLSHDKGKGVVIMPDTFKASVINAMKEAQVVILQELIKRKFNNGIHLLMGDTDTELSAEEIAHQLIKEIES